MGSYNISCNVTQLSIGYDCKVALIPLTSSAFHRLGKNGTGSAQISNGGPCGEWVPFTLPIFGTYNTYGVIEDIERDDNVEHIEKYFGCTIDEFIAFVCRPFDFTRDSQYAEKVPEGSRLEKLRDGIRKGKYDIAASMIHRHTFDRFIETPLAEYPVEPETVYAHGRITVDMLKNLGFVATKLDKGYSCIHPTIPNVEVISPDNWSIQMKINGKSMDKYGLYHFDDLANCLLENDQDVPMELMVLKHSDLSVSEYEYDSIVEKMLKMSFPEMLEDRISFSWESVSCQHDLDFAQVYEGMLDNSDVRFGYISYKNLRSTMFSNNLRFMPSSTGPQCGARGVERLRAQLILEQLDLLTKKENDDCGDDCEDDENSPLEHLI